MDTPMSSQKIVRDGLRIVTLMHELFYKYETLQFFYWPPTRGFMQSRGCVTRYATEVPHKAATHHLKLRPRAKYVSWVVSYASHKLLWISAISAFPAFSEVLSVHGYFHDKIRLLELHQETLSRLCFVGGCGTRFPDNVEFLRGVRTCF